MVRSMETGSKGNKVDFNMFKKWGKDNIIGYKTIEEGGQKFVNLCGVRFVPITNILFPCIRIVKGQ